MAPRAVIVGLPGVGKSSVGARLARRLAVGFIDSDELVVQQAGRSITAIFAEVGEPGFRALETSAVLAALQSFDGVLALGGGAVTTPAVRDGLASSGVPVVLLTADQQALLRRVGRSTHRPLLAGDPAARLVELSQQRMPWYEQVSTLTIETVGRSVNAVAAELAERIKP
jgi:shikimate kinase